jgi:hypothetical protein
VNQTKLDEVGIHRPQALRRGMWGDLPAMVGAVEHEMKQDVRDG